MSTPLDLAQIARAAQRIAGYARHTPLLESAVLNEISGTRILMKVESLQEAGSFKFRGALNALLSLGAAARARGVVAYSSGNHALAVSTAAARLDIPAVVVMPRDAPSPKILGARRAGAEVILYDREHEDRENICRRLCEERGLSLIAPYDDHQVMAGQGTVALEAIAQAERRGVEIDALLVPCSGGGLAAGCATALRASSPTAWIATVEPVGFEDTARSLAVEREFTNDAVAGSICDALLVRTPGRLTLPVLRECGATGLTVTDDAVRSAMRFAMNQLKLAVEPGGAVGLAAAMGRLLPAQSRAALVILSGGNVEPALLANVLLAQDVQHG